MDSLPLLELLQVVPLQDGVLVSQVLDLCCLLLAHLQSLGVLGVDVVGPTIANRKLAQQVLDVAATVLDNPPVSVYLKPK